MHVLAIYQVNDHLAQLMAEAKAERLARTANTGKPSGGVRGRVASLFAARRPAAQAPSAA